MPGLRIRRFKKSDVVHLKQVADKAFDSQSDKYWSIVGALRAPHTYVAVYGKIIVGAIEFEAYRLPKSIEGHIWYIFVDPKHQNRGIGTMLLRKAEKVMVEEGAIRFWALTGPDNIKTQRFFEKNNYRRVSIAEMKEILGSKNTKRLLRRMIYWEGDIIYVKGVQKNKNVVGANQSI